MSQMPEGPRTQPSIGAGSAGRGHAASKGIITVVHLYPREMSIYGDLGNTRCVLTRIERHGYTPRLVQHHPGDDLPADAHLILGGGGQDSGQARVVDDLFRHGSTLSAMAGDGVPMMLICGTYQLFGHAFHTSDGQELPGLGILAVSTRATSERMIGPCVLDTEVGAVVGYENHSGATTLDAGQQAFGAVRHGFGNNGSDGTGGARTGNVIGHYLHGPVLPANPALADLLIADAAQQATGRAFEPNELDDTTAQQARTRQLRRLLGDG